VVIAPGVKSKHSGGNYFPAFSFAHLFRCEIAIFLRAAADILRPREGAGFAAPLD
jgi:hypothetical protein